MAAETTCEQLLDRELYRAVFENAAVGIRIAEATGAARVVAANRAMHELFGYSPGELVGRSMFDLIHPDDQAENHRLTVEMAAGRLPSFQVENRYLRRDGELVWGRLTVSPLRDANGAITHTVGVVEDVTSRRHYQAELQAQSAKLARTTARTTAILDSAVDSIVTIDERGRIESVNPATERLFGYRADELVGRNVRILMPSPYREEHDGYLGRYLRTGERRIIGIGREVVAQRKDGTLFPVDLAVSEVPLQGERLFVGTIRDITARKHLEDQLRQAMKIEAIGRLAGGVAHDFNNLLASILGYSEQLAAALPAGALRNAAEQIEKSADRGAGLTRQLLAFSRRQELVPERLDLGLVLGELHDMLARLLGEQVELRCKVGESLWPVLADRGQLEQVVLNLAVNARDAVVEDHGRITLAVDNVEVSRPLARPAGTVAAGRWVRLQVQDDGCGMTPEVRSRIFEPFFTTKELGKGTGLGLSTVYGIVQQSGGSILVDSEPGRGSTFEIYLPSAEGRQAATAPAAVATPALGGHERLLLVEDDETFRGLLADVLRQAGYDVLVAAEPAEALAHAAMAEPIDLLISDLAMPMMKGSELARRLVAGRPSLRVLLMSGYSERDEAVGVATELGGAFLAKPFRIAELLDAARRLLDAAPSRA